MYEQKSNLGSILVALLAIALILGGVFLLNQSFNNTKNKDLSNLSTSSNSSLLVIKNSSSSGLLGLDSDSSSNTSLSSDKYSDKFSSSNSNSSLGFSSNSDKSTNSTNSSNSDKSNSTSSEKNSTLKVGEFTAKAITPTAKGSNWEIIECNVTTVYFCKPGFKFPFSQSGKLDKTYKFSGGSINDTKAGLAVSGINPLLID